MNGISCATELKIRQRNTLEHFEAVATQGDGENLERWRTELGIGAHEGWEINSDHSFGLFSIRIESWEAD